MTTQEEKVYLEGSNVCEDYEWEDLCDDMTNLMNRINPGGDWHCDLSNFGWRGTSGHKDFGANTGGDLFSEILPNTECYFRVYDRGDEIHIENFHHDRPMGGEWYVLTPQSESDEE